MVRGNAKIEAQKKAQKKLDESKKAGSQLEARKAGMLYKECILLLATARLNP